MTHPDPFSLESQYILDDDDLNESQYTLNDDELDRDRALADWGGTASPSSSQDSAILTPASSSTVGGRRARSQKNNALDGPSSTISSSSSHRPRSTRGKARGAARSYPALPPDVSQHHRVRLLQVLELHQHFWSRARTEAEAAGAVCDTEERYGRAMGRSELAMWVLAVVTAGFVGWRIGRG